MSVSHGLATTVVQVSRTVHCSRPTALPRRHGTAPSRNPRHAGSLLPRHVVARPPQAVPLLQETAEVRQRYGEKQRQTTQAARRSWSTGNCLLLFRLSPFRVSIRVRTSVRVRLLIFGGSLGENPRGNISMGVVSGNRSFLFTILPYATGRPIMWWVQLYTNRQIISGFSVRSSPQQTGHDRNFYRLA